MKIVCGGRRRVRVRVIQDEDAENPQGWDNLGKMMCWHARHRLGWQHSCTSPGIRKSWVVHRLTARMPRTPETAAKQYDKLICAELPLYLFDHSGLSISTTPFNCSWDSGQVGWIWCDWATAQREYGSARSTRQREGLQETVIQQLWQEVETYDQWLRGDVYDFVIEEEADERDSWCDKREWHAVSYGGGGFYGSDHTKSGLFSELDARYPGYRDKIVSTY